MSSFKFQISYSKGDVVPGFRFQIPKEISPWYLDLGTWNSKPLGI
jgi:hypothetical protein